MTHEPVRCAIDDGVAVVTLDNPPLNLVTLAFREFKMALQLGLELRIFVRKADQSIEIVDMGRFHGVRVA